MVIIESLRLKYIIMNNFLQESSGLFVEYIDKPKTFQQKVLSFFYVMTD